MQRTFKLVFRSRDSPGAILSRAFTSGEYKDSLVGFIGLGNMGAPMASNLLRSGVRVIAYDPSAIAVSKLTQLGALSASSPKQLSETPGLRAVITMLPSTDVVKEVYEGVSGVLAAEEGVRAPLLVDSSTISPHYVGELACKVAGTQLHRSSARLVQEGDKSYPSFLDAPVSGGTAGAQAATLTFMCGGDAAAFAAAQPLLMMMGKHAVLCGSYGAGQAAKLCNNLALSIQMAGLSEALALGRRLGLDPTQLSNVINMSSARCWTSEKYNPCPGVMPDVPSSNDYRVGFSAALMVKDVRLALEAAHAVAQQGGVSPTPMGDLVLQLYQQVADSSTSPIDFSAIFKTIYHSGLPALGQPPPGGDQTAEQTTSSTTTSATTTSNASAATAATSHIATPPSPTPNTYTADTPPAAALPHVTESVNRPKRGSRQPYSSSSLLLLDHLMTNTYNPTSSISSMDDDDEDDYDVSSSRYGSGLPAFSTGGLCSSSMSASFTTAATTAGSSPQSGAAGSSPIHDAMLLQLRLEEALVTGRLPSPQAPPPPVPPTSPTSSSIMCAHSHLAVEQALTAGRPEQQAQPEASHCVAPGAKGDCPISDHLKIEQALSSSHMAPVNIKGAFASNLDSMSGIPMTQQPPAAAGSAKYTTAACQAVSEPQGACPIDTQLRVEQAFAVSGRPARLDPPLAVSQAMLQDCPVTAQLRVEQAFTAAGPRSSRIDDSPMTAMGQASMDCPVHTQLRVEQAFAVVRRPAPADPLPASSSPALFQDCPVHSQLLVELAMGSKH